jgi:hypothetical protein
MVFSFKVYGGKNIPVEKGKTVAIELQPPGKVELLPHYYPLIID